MTMPRRPSEPTVAIVVPIRKLYDGDDPVVVRRPGRPRRVETAPTISEADYHQAIARAVERGIEQDEVVVASLKDDPKLVIEKTMVAVASEAGALLWDRIRSQSEGKAEAARISSRRVAALVRLAELAVIREQMESENPDPKPEDISKVIAMLLADTEAAVHEVAPAEVAQAFISKLKQKIASSSLASTGAAGTEPS